MPKTLLDDELAPLVGVPIPSERREAVSYSLEGALGEGGFAVACLATRRGIGDPTPVVLKIMRPRVVANAGETVARVVKKESVALGRLNERTPPSPFVVRLLDVGHAPIDVGGQTLSLPWLALEYVHGGIEGGTLRERVRYAVKETGLAFDAARGARALEQLAEGLHEIHSVDVVHRDLKPGNVLCCGFGETEVLKITDFGIARPAGVASTFGDQTLGTPGYLAPEQLHLRHEIGPWTDVFGLAAMTYFLLTGERYFTETSAVEAVMAASSGSRRSVTESQNLDPELRADPEACRAIDDALARATADDPRSRVSDARLFAEGVLPWLGRGRRRFRTSARLLRSVTQSSSPVAEGPPSSRVVGPRSGQLIVVSVAWESDGHCLAVTNHGLQFWDGAAWSTAADQRLGDVSFVRRTQPGSWLFGGAGGVLHALSRSRYREVARSRGGVDLVQFDGDPDDLAIAIAVGASGPEVHTLCAGRWLRPLPLEAGSTVTALSRLEDEAWLVVGRGASGSARAYRVRPLDWSAEPLEAPESTALLACASQTERGLAVASGAGGAVVRVDRGAVSTSVVDGAPTLSAAGVDVLDQEWVASAGRIWRRTGNDPWRLVWQDASWTAPFVSLFCEAGRVLALTADAGVVECVADAEVTRATRSG